MRAGHYVFAIIVIGVIAWGGWYETNRAECVMSQGSPLIDAFTGTCVPAKE